METQTKQRKIEGTLAAHLVSSLEGRKCSGVMSSNRPEIVEDFGIRGVEESKLRTIDSITAEYFAGRNLQIRKNEYGSLVVFDGSTPKYTLSMTTNEDNSFDSRNCRERPYTLLFTLIARGQF